MSECVVRMEMPKDCFECPFGIIDDTEDGVWCNALAQQSSGQREDCPIICQLPEGHGRLVDARSLFDEVYEYYGQDNESNENWMMDMINCSPTIVPADGESPSPKPTDPLPIRGVEYVPTEVDVQTGTVTYELRERSET